MTKTIKNSATAKAATGVKFYSLPNRVPTTRSEMAKLIERTNNTKLRFILKARP